jgi:hypothetical protein
LVDPVTSTIVHSSGTVVATCSGQRSIPNFEESDSGSEENERSDDERDEENDRTESTEDSDDDESSTYSVKQTGRTPDNSIKVWSL